MLGHNFLAMLIWLFGCGMAVATLFEDNYEKRVEFLLIATVIFLTAIFTDMEKSK